MNSATEKRFIAGLTILLMVFIGAMLKLSRNHNENTHLRKDIVRLQNENRIYFDEAVEQNKLYEKTLSELRTTQNTLKTLREKRSNELKAASRSRVTPIPKRRLGSFYDITQYCDTGNRTASGKWPEPGMVASLSRNIPLGTRVSIEGLGEFVVEDRVGYGTDFDIFTHSCSGAVQFGRKHLRVTILGE